MATVRIGQLTRRLTVQQRGTSQGTSGQPSITWTTIATVWAHINPLSGRELERAQSIRPDISHEITIRYNAAFANPKTMDAYRGLYKGRIFDFRAPLNPDESNVALVILATEGINQG